MKCTFLLGNLKTVNFGYFEFSVNHDNIPQSFNVAETKTLSKMGLRVMSHLEDVVDSVCHLLDADSGLYGTDNVPWFLFDSLGLCFVIGYRVQYWFAENNFFTLTVL